MTDLVRDGCTPTTSVDARPGVCWLESSDCDCERDTVLLTVVVPVYNEVLTIDPLLRRVLAAPYRKQVVVVDDGSHDGTEAVLRGWEGRPDVTVLRHLANRGKGAAIRSGLDVARGRFTLVQDADLEYDPGEYPRLLEPLLAGQADAVYGSRYLGGGDAARPPWTLNRLGVMALNLWLRQLYGASLTDEATCYKVFPTDVLRRMDLLCDRFEFCPEVTAKALRLGLRILEVPVSYRPRRISEGKKIRWSDGVAAAATLWRYRDWSPRVV